ncbi:hypothetical protein AB3331_11115 [Streptococcus sp. H49]|uniref:hypothetical protein n=1 Tax=Streptococcus huangxiaojuni TaxID=3237239 RepID=UPI0034A39B13
MGKSIFGADFEESKRIINFKKLSNNLNDTSMNRSLPRRLFAFFIAGTLLFSAMLGLLFAMPFGLRSAAETGSVRHLSSEAVIMIGNIGQAMLIPNIIVFVIMLLSACFSILIPKRDISRQIFSGFPFLGSMIYTATVPFIYITGMLAFNRFGISGLLLQVLVGFLLIALIFYQGYLRTKAQLYDEGNDRDNFYAKLILGITIGTSFILLILSQTVFKGLTSDFNAKWYSYLLGLGLTVTMVVFAYSFRKMSDFCLFQGFYMMKYSKQYKDYLQIADENWYCSGRKKEQK